MHRIIALAGLAFGTIGGAFAGSVLPIDLSTAQVVDCTTASCVVGATTSAGTFENATFAAIYPTNPGNTPSPNEIPTSNGPGPFIIDAPTSGANGPPTNNSIFSGSKNATLLIDLGDCSGATGGGANDNFGPGGSCGIASATNIDTMITAGGSVGAANQGITITAEGINAAGVYTTDVFSLLPGVDYRIFSTAQVGAQCTVDDTNYTSTSCTSTSTNNTANTDPNNSNIKIYEDAFGPQTQSSTTYYIDTQALNLGTTFAGGYLDSLLIQYAGPQSGAVSKSMVLDGLDVVGNAPEPGTFGTLGIGIGLIGLWTIRRKRAKSSEAVE